MLPAVCAPIAGGEAEAARAKPRHCGTIGVHDEFHPRLQASASHISCKRARRIMRAYLDGPASELEPVGPDGAR